MCVTIAAALLARRKLMQMHRARGADSSHFDHEAEHPSRAS
jgi:hypothetical protein